MHGPGLAQPFAPSGNCLNERSFLKAPPIAEDGAVVGVSVSTRLPQVDAIHILVASFEIGPGALPMVATRIKVAETTPVSAGVRARARLYRTSREVKITTPRCGRRVTTTGNCGLRGAVAGRIVEFAIESLQNAKPHRPEKRESRRQPINL